MSTHLFLLMLLVNSYAIVGSLLASIGLPLDGQLLVTTTLSFTISLFLLFESPRLTRIIFLLPYFFIQLIHGILNGASFLASLSTFSGYVLIFSLINYFLSLNPMKLGEILRKLTEGTIYILLIAHVTEIVIAGHGLHSLLMIQAPLLILSLILIYSTSSLDTNERKAAIRSLLLFLLWLIPSVLAEYMGGDFRPQLIPVALTALAIVLSVLFKLSERLHLSFPGIRVYWYKVHLIMLLVVSLSLSSVFISLILASSRVRSGWERFAIAESMYHSMSPVGMFIGKGYATSFSRFDISDFIPADLGIDTGEFDYSPHSGLMILIFENGFLGLFLFLLCSWHAICFEKKRDRVFSSHATQGTHDGVRNSMLLLAVFWGVQNIFYVKGIPTPEIFFQDAIPQYSLLFVFMGSLLMSSRNSLRYVANGPSIPAAFENIKSEEAPS